MNQYGFKWPETLNCNRLPKISEQETTGNICKRDFFLLN